MHLSLYLLLLSNFQYDSEMSMCDLIKLNWTHLEASADF